MKITKDRIKTVVIIILIILLAGIILLPPLYNSVYNNGFVNGQVDVAITQTQTGNIFIVNNQTVQSYPLNVLCQALGVSVI